MTPQLKQAMADRETAIMQKVRPGYVLSVEAWVMSLLPIERPVLEAVARQLVDGAAIYGSQTGISREEFLRYAAEAYDLYHALIITEGHRNRDLVRAMARLVQG